LLYYGVEIWWRKMFYPRPSAIGGYRRAFVWDHVAVTIWAVAVPVALVALRRHWWPSATPGDLAMTVAFGWILPIAFFNAAMSTVIYLHHTHPRVVWTRGENVSPNAQLLGAVHVILPAWVERTLHHIMEHTAHHARPGIPLYRLTDGQTLLEERHETLIVERWSPRFHLDTLRRCKLFDLSARRWVGFDEAVG
jgi:omega-6 fatty acid desaturase (delta-12 desaturase)